MPDHSKLAVFVLVYITVLVFRAPDVQAICHAHKTLVGVAGIVPAMENAEALAAAATTAGPMVSVLAIQIRLKNHHTVHALNNM
jgi:tryptophan synthase beta subunit